MKNVASEYGISEEKLIKHQDQLLVKYWIDSIDSQGNLRLAFNMDFKFVADES
jgi:hypothetical protein